MEASTFGSLYKAAKQLENLAFSTLFPNEDWRLWRAEDLPQKAEGVKLNSRDTGMVNKALGSAIELRETMLRKCPYHTLKANQSHRGFITNLGMIMQVSTVPKPTYENEKQGRYTMETSETAQEETSLDEDEYNRFLADVLALLCKVRSCWRRVRFGLDITLASAESNCMYREISSFLTIAKVQNPHWFDIETYSRRTLPNELMEAQEAVIEMGTGRGSTNAGYLISLHKYSIDLMGSRHFSPVVLQELVRASHKERNCFSLFQASVSALSLLQLRVDWTENDLIQERSALSVRFNEFSTGIGREHATSKELRQLQKLQNGSKKCPDISTIGHLSAQLAANTQRTWNMEMDQPLLPALAHLYAFYTINGKEKVPVLEKMCADFDRLLFLDGRRPQTSDRARDSLEKWVFPHSAVDIQRATELSIELQKQLPLLLAIQKHEFSINESVQQRLRLTDLQQPGMPLLSLLMSSLRRDMSAYSDLNNIWDVALHTARLAMNRPDLSKNEAAMHVVALVADGSYLQRWRTLDGPEQFMGMFLPKLALSIAAFVGSLVDTTLQTVQFLSGTIGRIKDAPSVITSVRSDLQAVETVLCDVQTALRADYKKAVLDDQIKPAVENCKNDCIIFQSVLEGWHWHCTEDKQFWMDRWGALLGQETVENFKARLNDYRATLTMTTESGMVEMERSLQQFSIAASSESTTDPERCV